jgi:hypothetical protein
MEAPMADKTQTPNRGPSDATDYSSTKAPDTQEEAREQEPHATDHRLMPGGLRGAHCDPGMSSLDRDTAISGGSNPGQTRYGDRADTGE